MVKIGFIGVKTVNLIIFSFYSISWCMDDKRKETQAIDIPIQKVLKNHDGTLNWVPFDYNKHFSNMSGHNVKTILHKYDQNHSKSLPTSFFKFFNNKKKEAYQKMNDN